MNNSILKNKNFLCLISGKLISLMGTQIQDFAMSLYVLKITGSAAKFASVLAITVIPQIILGPICGVFADWFDRKKMMILLDVLSGFIVLSMGIVYKINSILPMSYIYFSAVALSVISLLYSFTGSSVIPGIIEKDKLLKANSINSTITSIPQIAGPLFSGIIFGFFGLFYIIVINSISFFISAVFNIIIDIPKNTRKNLKFDFKQFKSDFKEGVIFIKNKKIVLKIVICGFFINFALDPLSSTGITYIGKKVLLLSDAEVGTMQSILALGILIGSIVPGIIKSKLPETKIFGRVVIISGTIVLSVCMVLVLFYNKIISNVAIITVSIMALLLVMVTFIIICNIILSTIFQKEVPMDFMGRASSVLNTLCTAAMPAGQMIIGGMFDYTKAYIPVGVAGMIILLSGLIYNATQKNSNIIEEKECRNA